MKSIYLCMIPQKLVDVYSENARRRIAGMTEVLGTITSPDQFDSPMAKEAEVVFSTWGMPTLTEEELARYFPNLKAVFYGAGSVQAFARPLLARGIRLFSAWQANAVPVAEYALAQILLSLQGFFQVEQLTRTSREKALERF